MIVAAGDDVSLPERARRIVNEYREARGCAFSICSAALLVEEDGSPLRVLSPDRRTLTAEALARRYSTLLGATQAWHRDVFAVFGPYDPCIRPEDHIIPFGAALLGEIRAIQEPLVLYRSHSRTCPGVRAGAGAVVSGTSANSAAMQRRAFSSVTRGLPTSRWPSRGGSLRAELLKRLCAATNARLKEATAEVRIASHSGALTRVAEVFRAVANGCRTRVGVRWMLQYGRRGSGRGYTAPARRFRDGDRGPRAAFHYHEFTRQAHRLADAALAL